MDLLSSRKVSVLLLDELDRLKDPLSMFMRSVILGEEFLSEMWKLGVLCCPLFLSSSLKVRFDFLRINCVSESSIGCRLLLKCPWVVGPKEIWEAW